MKVSVASLLPVGVEVGLPEKTDSSKRIWPDFGKLATINMATKVPIPMIKANSIAQRNTLAGFFHPGQLKFKNQDFCFCESYR